MKYMEKNVELGRRVLYIVIGNFLLAFSVVFFVLPNNILTGGVASLAIALSPFIHTSRENLIFILNLIMFVLGYIFLGRKFALRSFLSTLLYPIFVYFLSMLDTSYFHDVDPFVSALYAGLIMGVGLGLVFKVDASTGGMDIPAMIMHKYAHLPLSECVLIIDAATILFGVYSFGINALLIGLFSVFASSFAINWTSTLGSQAAKNVIIISDKAQEVRNYLLEGIGRGVTVLDGTGGWTGEKRQVLMCVVSNRQYAQMEMEINELDPKAFIVVTDVHEVRGSGFTYKDGTL